MNSVVLPSTCTLQAAATLQRAEKREVGDQDQNRAPLVCHGDSIASLCVHVCHGRLSSTRTALVTSSHSQMRLDAFRQSWPFFFGVRNMAHHGSIEDGWADAVMLSDLTEVRHLHACLDRLHVSGFLRV
jgi:hypothetical protein